MSLNQTGTKNAGADHIVPLPRQAVTILRELFSLAVANDKTFVFPGMNKQTENGTVN
jgi:hypothetical protein